MTKIRLIACWNRLAVGFELFPGSARKGTDDNEDYNHTLVGEMSMPTEHYFIAFSRSFLSSIVRILHARGIGPSKSIVQGRGHHGNDGPAEVPHDELVVDLRVIAIPVAQVGAQVHLAVEAVAAALQRPDHAPKVAAARAAARGHEIQPEFDHLVHNGGGFDLCNV